MAYSISDTFSIINNILISVNKSNFALVFLKAACYANPGGEKKQADRAHIFQDTSSESSQIHEHTIIYHFKHKNHGIHLNFLFYNLDKFFLRVSNVHQHQ